MKKGIVVSFPGSRGTEIPLLYYGAKCYEDRGYEKVFLHYVLDEKSDFETIYCDVKNRMKEIEFADYEDIILIAKSVGTVFACRVKEELGIPASLILFTPIEETLPYIQNDNKVLLAAIGDRDEMMDSERLAEICSAENVQCIIEKGVGHRMEEDNNLARNLEIVKEIISFL